MSIIQSYWKIIVLAVVTGLALIVVIAVASPASPPESRVEAGTPDTPYASLDLAFLNLAAEAAERLESSPLQMLGAIADTMNRGSLAVDFSYRDSAVPFGGNVGGQVTLFSDAANSEFAIETVVNLLGGMMNIDVDLYINNERLALRSSLMGSAFYGITFSTFREDIRHFGPLIGLDDFMMEQIADFVEAIDISMNEASYSPEESLEPYIDLFTEFIGGIEYSAEITVEGYTHIQFIITEEDILAFLNSLYALIEEDETLRNALELYDNPIMEDIDMPTYEEFLREFRDAISEFENSISLEVVLEFLIDSQNRLEQMNIRTNASADGMPGGIVNITTDLGRSVYDPWVVNVVLYSDYDAFDSSDGVQLFNFTWSFSEDSHVFENTMDISFDNEGLSFASLWAEESGEFSLSFESGMDSGSLSGIFTSDEYGSFFLEFDDFNLSSTETLSLSLTASPGAEILPIDFINLDEWGYSFLDAIGMLMGLIP
ncbi:MAG: hypothetical protein FWE24_06335 [Defluviitaleaceae bacterium]|nr:hypothetical protein [Defluviitaleaceae bacterium]